MVNSWGQGLVMASNGATDCLNENAVARPFSGGEEEQRIDRQPQRPKYRRSKPVP
jgi:hypothetical protein